MMRKRKAHILKVSDEEEYKKLREVSRKIDDFSKTKETIEMIREHMNENTLGLSAIQLGIPQRIFFMRNPYNKEQISVCINPEIIKANNKKRYFVETCESIGEDKILTARDSLIKVVFNNEDGKRIKRTLTGIESVVFQHELDHLNGTTLLERKEEFKNEK